MSYCDNAPISSVLVLTLSQIWKYVMSHERWLDFLYVRPPYTKTIFMLYSLKIILSENVLLHFKISAIVWLQCTCIRYLLTEQSTIYLVPDKGKNGYLSPVTVFIQEIMLRVNVFMTNIWIHCQQICLFMVSTVKYITYFHKIQLIQSFMQ